MRRILLIAASLSCLAAMASCDFLRSAAGRPTSEDIALKRAELKKAEQAAAARSDSLRIAEAARKADAEAEAAFDALKLKTRAASTLSRVDASSLKSRYYIVIGAFGNVSNAERLASKSDQAGLGATLVKYLGGRMTAVAVCPSETKAELYRNLQKARQHSFCPEDAWVLTNE